MIKFKEFKSSEEKKKFYLKASIVSSVTLAISAVAFSWFGNNYAIHIDSQVDRCLPDSRVYLVDKNDKNTVRGGLFAFKAKGLKPYIEEGHQKIWKLADKYEDGKKLLKIIDGMPGDTVEVTASDNLINGESIGEGGLLLKGTLLKDESHFTKKYVLDDKQYFFAGRTNRSFDSRYWGPVEESEIIGRAIALF